MRNHSVKKGAAILIGALLVGGSAACSSGTPGDTSPASTGTADSSDFQAFLETAQQAVADATAPQTQTPPTTGPTPKPGLNIVIISCSQAAEGCSRPAGSAMEAIESIGWKGLLVDTAGDPTKQQAAVDQAISTGADGIIVLSIDSAALKSSIEKAQAAGIPVVSTAAGNDPDLYDATVPEGDAGYSDGYLMGQYTLSITDDAPSLLLTDDNEFAFVSNRIKGAEAFVEECKAAGGSCSVAGKQSIQVADLATGVPAQSAAFARQIQGWNVFFSGYDAALGFQMQGLEQASITQGAAVGFDGNAQNIDIIRNGGYEKATIALPMEWVGYGAVDQLNRLTNGEEPVDQGVRTKLITKENAPESGAFNGDIDVVPSYLKLWGVN
ncbi:substrate-binding domain-containing protein [Salinibacterium sp. ZJ454]|uniref:sugar ABC transporter substrate-binding protein n=1 Tax=Salinibacterium sp. ZJ454 TaxID=2708339 RepID=UPI00141F37F1|nr:substrate-binding domain-containing protein [Salinibacterium sp. ZJ454]